MRVAELLCWKVGRRATPVTMHMNCTISMFWRVMKTQFDGSDDSFVKSVTLYSAEVVQLQLNPLVGTSNYSATSNNMKLVHWPLTGRLLHLVQRGGTGRGHSLPRPLLTVSNVTVHPSMASVPITVMLYNGLLLWTVDVPIKGLMLPQTSGEFTVSPSLSLVLMLSPTFGLRSKISQKVKSFFVYTQQSLGY